jgi:hypothetical protein
MAPTGHKKRGGSAADRHMNCPASADLEADVPNESSPFAEEGTALHGAMEWLTDRDDRAEPEDVRGMVFGGYEMSHLYIEDAIRPALEYFDEVIGGLPYDIEVTAEFPGVPDAGGTTDVVAFDLQGRRLIVFDYKFGTGVWVSAVNNHQLQFYAVCVLSYYRLWDQIDTVELAICQPRIDHNSRWGLTVDELREWQRRYTEAALGPPRVAAGKWCRWCRYAPQCEAHKAELADRDARNWTLDDAETDAYLGVAGQTFGQSATTKRRRHAATTHEQTELSRLFNKGNENG